MTTVPRAEETTGVPGSVVFVLTSSGKDVFSAMTRVAIASIRVTNPNLNVSVHCDIESDLACRECADPLLDEVDGWVPHATPEGPAGFRNRFIKTSLRSRVGGSFLFLDSDVLVRHEIKQLFDIDADIAAAANHSRHTLPEQIWSEDADEVDRMGWSVSTELYVNGGVMLYQDTLGARRFGEEWHRLWLEAYQRGGRYRDQPALNAALKSSGARLARLSDRFNAQFVMNIAVIRDASIWHFYSSNDLVSAGTAHAQLVLATQDADVVNMSELERSLKAPHPWSRRGPIANSIARTAIARGTLRDWEAAFLSRGLRGYIMRRLRKCRHELRRRYEQT